MYQRFLFSKNTKVAQLQDSIKNPSVEPADEKAYPPPDIQQAPKTTHEMDKKLKRRGKYIKIKVPKD